MSERSLGGEGGVTRRQGDKAKEQIGFATETALRDGLAATIAWTRGNRETIRRCMLQHARFVPGLRTALE